MPYNVHSAKAAHRTRDSVAYAADNGPNGAGAVLRECSFILVAALTFAAVANVLLGASGIG
jgi:hypothetical protein